MVRYLPILLAGCVAIISGLIGAVGLRALGEYEKLSVEPMEMTLVEFASDQPDDKFRFRLTDLQHGASVYPEPAADDGEWQQVYVCLFPKNLKRLPKNYASVIVKFDGVKGKDELAKLLEDGELDVFYWPQKQKLPESVYNRMAKKYRGMLFDQCLHCETGGQPPSPDFGNSCIYAGTAGVSLSFIGIIAFYLFRMLRSRRGKSMDWNDDKPEQFANKAGLPSSWPSSQNASM